jgi:hypothetical protein
MDLAIMTRGSVSDPLISPALLARVLAKLEASDGVSLDLEGLNRIYAAFSAWCRTTISRSVFGWPAIERHRSPVQTPQSFSRIGWRTAPAAPAFPATARSVHYCVYLVDAQLASFSALPLVPGRPATTGRGIHDISAVPLASGFDVHWFPGSNRQRALIMRPDLALAPVGHDYFVAQYMLSASSERKRSPFNVALFIARHFPTSIQIVSAIHGPECQATKW